jgi:hypothetical protein
MRIVLVIILFWFSSCEKQKSQIASEPELTDDKDIWGSGRDNFQESQYSFLNLNRMKEIQLGKTTEKELYEIFGKKINIRLTYTNNPLPKMYKDKYIPIDKLISYFDAIGTETEIPNGKKYETFEKLSVTFYLYKNRIQFFAIRHRDTKVDKLLNTSTIDVIKYEKIHFGSMWPNQGCDRDFYDHTVLKVNKPYSKVFPCEWHEASFEKKLKEDGYYELLKR